jgi:hypothetical protein
MQVDEEAIARHPYATFARSRPGRTHQRDAAEQFLLWQLAYAEIYVTATSPDFRGQHLLEGCRVPEARTPLRRGEQTTPSITRRRMVEVEKLGIGIDGE